MLTSRKPSGSFDPRRNELADGMSRRGLVEFDRLPRHGRVLDILDVGTGISCFAVHLAECGHRICGIDRTPVLPDEKGLDFQGIQ